VQVKSRYVTVFDINCTHAQEVHVKNMSCGNRDGYDFSDKFICT
jgi:hypothetical protein